MLVLGVIPYVLFSLAYRKFQNQVRPAAIDLERYKYTFKDPCDCTSYDLKRRPVSALPNRSFARVQNPDQKLFSRAPEILNRASCNGLKSYRSTDFYSYRNVENQHSYRNYGEESQPTQQQQLVFVNFVSV